MYSSKTLSKGFVCECGKDNKFPLYVYSHWEILLDMTCDCGIKYTILKGTATKVARAKGLVKRDKS